MKKKEPILRFRERFGYIPVRPEGELVWFHAASVGEMNSLIPVIDYLSQNRPDLNLFLTTGTLSSARLCKQRLNGKVTHNFFPLDFLPFVKIFLNRLRPDLVIWTESELWPVMLIEAKRYAPVILLNARMSDQSFANWSKYKFIAKEILVLFDKILAQSKISEDYFKRLGANNVSFSGNLKYVGDPLPFDQEKLDRFNYTYKDRKVWVVASTHYNEEEKLIETYLKLKPSFPTLLLVIVPRHVERGMDIGEYAKSKSLKVSLRSKDELDPNADVYIADTMGELGIFYRFNAPIFIGGSLVRRGGQNPLEPARLGRSIIMGPYYFNFTEVVDEMKEHNAIMIASDEDELQEYVKQILSSAPLNESYSKSALTFSNSKNFILNNVIQELSSYLKD